MILAPKVIQVRRATQAHRDLPGLPEEAERVGLRQCLDLRVIRARRDRLGRKAPEVLRVCKVLLELRVSRVFPVLRVIRAHRDPLDLLAPPESVAPLGLLEKMRLVHNFPTTSLR